MLVFDRREERTALPHQLVRQWLQFGGPRRKIPRLRKEIEMPEKESFDRAVENDHLGM